MPAAAFPFRNAPPPLPTCGACGVVLRAEHLNTEAPLPCPACGAPGLTRVFPAMFRPTPAGLTGEDLATATGDGADGEAACFFHAGKRAAVPCDRCGRFLCRLCDLDFGDGRHLCPECLRAGRKDGAMPELINERPAHDWGALVLALAGAFWVWLVPLVNLGWGIFVGLMSVMPAAAALFLCARFSGETGRGPVVTVGPRLRFGLALLLGLCTVLAWGAWVAYRMAFGFD